MGLENISPVGAKFVFAGKELRMIFINKAVKYLKEKHGGFKKAIESLDDVNGELDFNVLADVLYAGFMVNKDETLTPEYISEVLDEMTLPETRTIARTHLIAAMTGTYPDYTEGDRDTENPQT